MGREHPKNQVLQTHRMPKLEKVSANPTTDPPKETPISRALHPPSPTTRRGALPRRYKNWKASKDEIDAEFSKNKELGERLGCWKAGMLVDNDEGEVALALKEIE